MEYSKAEKGRKRKTRRPEQTLSLALSLIKERKKVVVNNLSNYPNSRETSRQKIHKKGKLHFTLSLTLDFPAFRAGNTLIPTATVHDTILTFFLHTEACSDFCIRTPGIASSLTDLSP
jgi:hypothetical protein